VFSYPTSGEAVFLANTFLYFVNTREGRIWRGWREHQKLSVHSRRLETQGKQLWTRKSQCVQAYDKKGSLHCSNDLDISGAVIPCSDSKL
jgi:hypothetical protein